VYADDNAAADTTASAVWRDTILGPGGGEPASGTLPTLELVRQDYEQLEMGRSVIQTPMRKTSMWPVRGN
jgi:hypothetical protein